MNILQKLRDLGKEAPHIFIYSTGAGAGIQKRIWEVPGCSSFLVGCGFPYASSQTSKYIGFTPDKFVSVDTSIELAMAAYLQAYQPNHRTIGVGLTASVASMTEHRGAHRIIVSTFSSDCECLTFSLEIPKGHGLLQRITDGELSDAIGIAAILRASHLWNDEDMIYSKIYVPDGTSIQYPIKYSPFDNIERARELIVKSSYFHMNGSRLSENDINTNKIVFYPGSFNPFHFGHEQGAEAIRQTIANNFGECREVVFTTVINPSHKAPLSTDEMLNRVSTMKGKNFCLTVDDPLFVDKARKHPGGWFGMGADTLLTMLDPKWGYSARDLILEFQKLNIKIFVLGRLVKDQWITLSSLKEIYPDLNMTSTSCEDLFIEVPGRWDISSTELRNKLI